MKKLFFLILIFNFSFFIGCSSEGGGFDPVSALLATIYSGSSTPGENPPPGEAGAPTWVIASDAAFSDKVEVRWDPVPAQEYRVLKKSVFESTFQQIGSVTDPVYSDPVSNSQSLFQYAIQVVDLEGKISPVSIFDTGTVGFNSSCSTKLNSLGGGTSLYSRFKNGFPGTAISISSFGNSVLVASGTNVYLLNVNGDMIGVWTGISPKAMVVDVSNRIFALVGMKIFELNSDCTQTSLIDLPGDSSPKDLALDTSGNLYISEANFNTGTDRIFKYSSAGDLLKTWDLPGTFRQPNAIFIHPSDNSLLVADNSSFNLYQYDISGDTPVQLASKEITVGQIIDMTMSGVQILVAIQQNSASDFGPHLVRFHSGMSGGSVTMRINPAGFSTIQSIATDNRNGNVFAVDTERSSILSCAAPIFSNCSPSLVGISPLRIVRDDKKNFYILHATKQITKLNSNGAHLSSFILPSFQGSAIQGADMEIDGDFLYISGRNDSDTKVLVKVKTDFTGVTTRNLPANSFVPFTNIAVTDGKVFSDFVDFGEEDTFTYLNFSSVNGGGEGNFVDQTYRESFILSTDELETDYAGIFYHMITALGESGDLHTSISKFNSKTLEWNNLVQSATTPFQQITTDKSGNLYTLEGTSNSGYKIFKRDSNFTELNQTSIPTNQISPSAFYVSDTGDSSFLATPLSLHKIMLP
ncbi:hypothetical protein CH352_16180 [Leptospira hartskeerlii]|uniref:Fibronectin type-III domain-containing protein n=1 Tax=Leptospira hartskeerlii TaxID=2023177 RepID=A0A2M9XA24_9LEPT|nr:hypothetical protein [Leptospira hartskeerlii]PJZ24382.1 hypothetical protein CH357_16675 [Leptospira hartskeerlii]PJZ32540.1 hypothetical protein CH352_16180 [Leptospira hartskeerlii]